jgi:hypothetical protein
MSQLKNVIYSFKQVRKKEKETHLDINVSHHGNTVETHPSPSALAVLRRTNDLEQTIHFFDRLRMLKFTQLTNAHTTDLSFPF